MTSKINKIKYIKQEKGNTIFLKIISTYKRKKKNKGTQTKGKKQEYI